MPARKASVLIISLWVLAILAMLVISAGQRVSLAIKLSQFERDSNKAFWLARAGLNRAIAVIDSDTNSFDSSNEPWAKNEQVFRRISLGNKQDEFASVSYEFEHNGIKETVFGVVAEESKINVQLATEKLLRELCNACDTDTTLMSKLVEYILLRRGSGSGPPPGDIDPDFIKKDLANPPELLVVFEYFFRQNGYPDYQKKAQTLFSCIKDKITVWGGLTDKVNINTASKEVLTILLKSLAEDANEVLLAPGLANEVIALRDKNLGNNPLATPFAKEEDLIIVDVAYAQLLGKLKKHLIFSPGNYFYLRCIGNCAKLSRNLSAVYERSTKKIVFWHEN
jgi:hypothetical protein